MKYYIPSNLDLTAQQSFPVKHLEKYYYLISLLNTNRIYYKTKKNTDFINLKSVYLRNILTPQFSNKVINDLKKWGVIEVSKSYQVGVRSKGYRLSKLYRDVEVLTHPVSAGMVKKIDKHAYSEIKADTELLTTSERVQEALKRLNDRKYISENKYEHLQSHLKAITIEYDEAITQLNKIKHKITADEYNITLISIDKIHDGHFYFKLDKTTGRIYTNITNLNKEFRKFLRYAGEPLVEIDIANSQPLLFNAVLRNSLQHKGNNIYEKLTTQGNFYQYFTKQYNATYKEKKTVKEIKELVFGKIFFCRKFMNSKYKESKLFKRLFPSEYNVGLASIK